jgi:sugar/nucleoside kinase (ribokinase family)
MHNFIAIGDTVTDAFIRLKEAEITGTPDTPDYKISLPFAEKIPYESVTVVPAVGNAANAAVSAAKLGLNTALVTDIGDDQPGKDCLASLEASGVDPKYVHIHQSHKTNYHYALWYQNDRTILTKHESFEYAFPPIEAPKWLYFSSVSLEAFPYHEFVADFLDTHPDVRFAFQPGKGEITLGKEKLARFYKRAEIFFCNIEEAGAILGINTLGPQELLKRMHELGPKIVVITDGPKGAYAYNGTDMWFVPVFPDGLNALERTGAGDAFASTTTAALSLGNDLATALTWGAVNSASVVQAIGAQKGLLKKDEILNKLSSTPDFKAKKL